MLAAIVAVDENWAIGRNGSLLCHLPADMRRFKSLTMGCPVIMGRKTWESLPKGALPGRLNVVVTRNSGYQAPGAVVCTSVEAALAATASAPRRFIIGGAQLYASTIDAVDTLYLTRIHATFPDADTFFPSITPTQWETAESEFQPADGRNPHSCTFLTLHRL